MKVFVCFKKQPWEKVNAYSLVDQDTFNAMPSEIVYAHKETEDKLYSTPELEKMRDDLCK